MGSRSKNNKFYSRQNICAPLSKPNEDYKSTVHKKRYETKSQNLEKTDDELKDTHVKRTKSLGDKSIRIIKKKKLGINKIINTNIPATKQNNTKKMKKKKKVLMKAKLNNHKDNHSNIKQRGKERVEDSV